MNSELSRFEESPGRVMIVEDDRLVALDLETMLEGFGFKLCPTAHSAEDALDIAHRHQPDLVLMDIRLEGEMDGITAASVLSEKLGIQVVYLTAHSDLSTVNRAKETHPYGYLLKPVRALDLRCCLEVALHKARHSPHSSGSESKTVSSTLLNGLSAREVEVLGLIARGHTSKDIAQVLNIAKPTVDTYRSRLADKLGVRSRSELVAIAGRAGLL
ncbi:MAG: response regulator transcription factor [Myxococcales bacterium]